MNLSSTNENQIPTRLSAVVFRTKTAILQARRSAENARGRMRANRLGNSLESAKVLARSTTELWTETSAEERFLVAGKIQNLRMAVKRINGLELEAGEVFSFWKNVGRTSRLKGFVAGRELRQGCIIPSVGGGLCQLSNGLYDAAVAAGLEIIERHAHTKVIPGSLAEAGRDATVFWNYVDLRFRSPVPLRIEAELTGTELKVRLRGAAEPRPRLHQLSRTPEPTSVNSCASCGMDDCFRVVKPQTRSFGKAAFLVDERVTEFDKYIQEVSTAADELFVPLDGKLLRQANYAWSTEGFAKVRQSPLVTLKRSYTSRRLAAQGAARQKNLLAMYEQLADSYARKLDHETLHVVVQQQLLPFLWKKGHLGGRTFDVLMTSLPMAEIQSRLDAAYRLHPESRTLADFRADEKLINAEAAALAAADKIITTHTDIADLFSEKAVLLDWDMPATSARAKQASDKPTIVFPASTLGRKGCYELREAIRGLDVTLLTLGPVIEAADFWAGFDQTAGGDWMKVADAVVLPAFVEHKPRRLLMAAANGIPVIATPACGVSKTKGVTVVREGDAVELREAIVAAIAKLPAVRATKQALSVSNE